MLNHRKSQGIAIVAVLISAVVFLGIIIAITGTLSLSSRRSTGDQRVTLEAQYAAESGLSRVMAEAEGGLLSSWTQLMLKMKTSDTATAADIQRLAKRFCNYTDADTTMPAPTSILYCSSNTNVDITNRYSVFSNLIPVTTYATESPAIKVFSPLTSAPTTSAEAEIYWKNVFSPGNADLRFTNTVGNARYNVSFGLEPVRVEITNGSNYRFVFKARDSVSTGTVLINGKVISTRSTQRSFPTLYYIELSPPSFAYFLSLTDKQNVDGGGGSDTKVFFNGTTLFDGPVHTNGAFYFRGNPWFSSAVTSAGCTTGYATDANGNTTCTSGGYRRGYYNDVDPADSSFDTEFSIDNTDPTNPQAQFPGYTSGFNTQSQPEFVKGNFDPPNNSTYTPGAGSDPRWQYTGRYQAGVVRLPTVSDEQRELAAQTGATNGILVATATNPNVNPLVGVQTYYDSPSPEVFMMATDTDRGDSTSYAPASNNGTAARYQVVRIKVKEKISRCNAAPTGVIIKDPVNAIVSKTAAINDPFDLKAEVQGQQNYTYEYAPVLQTVTWSETEPSAPATATGEFTTATDQNQVGYKATSGYTTTGNPIRLTASTPGSGGVSSAVTLNVSAIKPDVTLNIDRSGIYYGSGSSANLNWDVTQGTTPVLYTLEQRIGAGPWTVVPGFSSTSFKTAEVTPAASTEYRVTATGPTGLTDTDLVNLVVAGPADPLINLNDPSDVTFEGGNAAFDWSISNTAATTNASGSGPGPYNYILSYKNSSVSTWTEVPYTNQPSSGAQNVSIPSNLTGPNQTWEFKVKATNTLTGKSNTSGTVTVLATAAAVPMAAISRTQNPTPLDFGGIPGNPGQTVGLSYNVTNQMAAGADTTYLYNYTIESSTTSSTSGFGSTAATQNVTPKTLNNTNSGVQPSQRTWYRVIAKNTVTNKTSVPSNAVQVDVATLPAPTIGFTVQYPAGPGGLDAVTVPAGGGIVRLNRTVKNASSYTVKKIYPTVENISGQTGLTPNGITLSGFDDKNVTGPNNSYVDFEFTATNASATVSKIVRVFIGAALPGDALPVIPLPDIVTLTAEGPVLYPDLDNKLTWTTSNATTATLTRPTGTADPAGSTSVGVNSNGTQTYNIVASDTTYTYTLTARNARGSISRTVSVSVRPPATPTVVQNNPSNQTINYTGSDGTSQLRFYVSNPTPSSGNSGAGTASTYDYSVEYDLPIAGTTWLPIIPSLTNRSPATSGSPITLDVTLPVNNTGADQVYTYRVKATNVTTGKSSTFSPSKLITVKSLQDPTIVLNVPPATAYPNQVGAITWSVSNAAQAGGDANIKYKLERRINGGSWVTLLSDVAQKSYTDTTKFTGTTDANQLVEFRVTATYSGVTPARTGTDLESSNLVKPDAPDVSNFRGDPDAMATPAGGTTTLKWTLDNATTKPISSITIDQGVGSLTPTATSKSGVNVSSTKTFKITVTGPTGLKDEATATITVPEPPKTLDGVDLNGENISRLMNKTGSPSGWTVAPKWSASGDGLPPTPYTYKVIVRADGTVVSSPSGSVNSGGEVVLNTGTLAIGTDEKTYTVEVEVTAGGATKTSNRKEIVVVRNGSGVSLRPRARLTQTTCSNGGPEAFSWPIFVEYHISENTAGDMVMYKRTYPSVRQDAWEAKPSYTDAEAPWKPIGVFNGMIYVDGGATIRGPERTTASSPATASPAVAHFARMTLATDGVITIASDLKYEKPVCTTSPFRTVTTGTSGVVTPADCEETQSEWQKNVLGLYSSGKADGSAKGGIRIKTTQPNTTIHAISMSSQAQIEVENVAIDPDKPACPTSLTPGNNLGSIQIQGGMIQKEFGQFGRLTSSNNISCGYGRSMTYDRRMQYSQYAPPGFPKADNAEWTIKIFTSTTSIDDALSAGQTLPLPAGFSRIR